MLLQIRSDGQLAAIEGAISNAINAIRRSDLEGHKISSRASDNDLRVDNLYAQSEYPQWT